MNFITTGYTGKDLADLTAWRASLNALLVDVRFSAQSQVETWRAPQLTSAMEGHYLHLARWGNPNYKRGDHTQIVIADFDGGLRFLEAVAAEVGYQNFILLCACPTYAYCHRKVLADLLAARGRQVNEQASWQSQQQSLF
jgi:uncharacterized protein (DUF488 family)